ncbi:hypothetical protein F9K33_14730 [bacterium]|nr:MAG: hypothetical protein F9K33_14730 [bacterium]
MNSKLVKMAVMLSCVMYVVSCDSDSKQKASRSDLDLLMRNQVTALLQNQLGLFTAGSNSSAIREGGPMGFWFYPPWMYYGASAGAGASAESIVTYTDTSYYDAASGYWVYQYTDSTFQWRWRYKFLPHDNDGFPTAETDQYLFDATYSGDFEDSYWGASYRYSGQTDFQVSGMKDWVDTLKNGTIVYKGSSESEFVQDFGPDTSVTFSYNETIDSVIMYESDCSPRSGSIEFLMMQDATPDTFVFVYRYDDSTKFEMPYKDFTYTGETIFMEDGVRYIIDGEEYYYEVDCDGGVVTMGKSPKLKLK